MCNSPSCNHDDDDPFAHLGEDIANVPVGPSPEINVPGTYTEPCGKCHGRGRFISYSGRDCGPCFTCKGAGKLTFKTSAKQRERGREAAQRAAKRKQDSIADRATQWRKEHAVEARWINDTAERFDFARSMHDALVKYGHLTDGQLFAVRRCIARDDERRAQREAERQEREARAQSVDITPIVEAFERARGNGIRSPKLRLDTFVFSRAPDHGVNAGAVYVKEGETYLGKIAGGKLITGRDCDSDTEARILVVAADPATAATAYGRRYGRCSICGRELTKTESINRAMGPICAERFGF